MNQKAEDLTKEWVVARLPKRPNDANKGTFGKVLVIAGSENYPGAAYLSCAACYRIGAGLVTLVDEVRELCSVTESSVKRIVSRKLPEVTFLAYDQVLEKINGYDVILLGPGLGQSDRAAKFVVQLLSIPLPMVIDGDGLNIISKIDKWWMLTAKALLTPHPGEMSGLTRLSIEAIQENRAKIAQNFADEWGQVVVLKGAETVIASPTEEAMIAPFANPALATAGTGDVLSGIIAGFIAQGISNFDAACCGVYIHGLAGEMVREEIGNAGALASDLLPFLPKALLHIAKH